MSATCKTVAKSSLRQSAGSRFAIRSACRVGKAKRAHLGPWWARGACHRAGRRPDPLALPTLRNYSGQWPRSRRRRPGDGRELHAQLIEIRIVLRGIIVVGAHLRPIAVHRLAIDLDLRHIGFGPVLRPISAPSTRRCTALAKICSSSVHCGIPTRAMLDCTASAIGLLKWRGAAMPTTFRVTLVSVIIAAASAILLPIS